MTSALPVLAAAALVGGLVYGSLGMGFSFVVIPAMVSVRPDAVPVAILFLGLPLTVYVAFRERGAVDLSNVAWLSAGRIVGTGGGIAVLASISEGALSVVVSASVIGAVLASVAGLKVDVSKASCSLGGAIAGAFGTVAALGGPVLGLLFQRKSGPEIRSTVAMASGVGVLLSLAGLLLIERVRLADMILAAQLMPLALFGVFLSGVARGWIDEGRIRFGLLTFALLASTLSIVNTLRG